MTESRKDPPEVGDILDAFVDEAPRKRGQSERTMETYRGHARSFLRYVLEVHGKLDVPSLTDDDVVGFLAAAKAKGDASTTRTTKLMSVRSFGAWMVDARCDLGPILVTKPGRAALAEGLVINIEHLRDTFNGLFSEGDVLEGGVSCGRSATVHDPMTAARRSSDLCRYGERTQRDG